MPLSYLRFSSLLLQTPRLQTNHRQHHQFQLDKKPTRPNLKVQRQALNILASQFYSR